MDSYFRNLQCWDPTQKRMKCAINTMEYTLLVSDDHEEAFLSLEGFQRVCTHGTAPILRVFPSNAPVRKNKTPIPVVGLAEIRVQLQDLAFLWDVIITAPNPRYPEEDTDVLEMGREFWELTFSETWTPDKHLLRSLFHQQKVRFCNCKVPCCHELPVIEQKDVPYPHQISWD